MIDRMKHYPLIEQIKEEDRQLLVPFLKENRYLKGAAILRQGEVSASFHIILQGQVSVYVENGAKVRVATLGHGQFFGEMSCMTGDAVSATVEADEEVTTLSISREGMLMIIDSSPVFRAHIIEAMVKRIQNSNDRVIEEHTRSLLMIKERESEDQYRYGEWVGDSLHIRELRKQFERLSKLEGTIYIQGEAGVGKMHAASLIHYGSAKEGQPLLTINGSDFQWDEWRTKALAAKGGTIILQQADLLPVDIVNELAASEKTVRVIMTGTEPPKVQTGNHLFIPPLRERADDIPLLVMHWLRKAGVHDPESAISQDALRKLGLFPYLSGNVEELMAVVQEAYILSQGKMIHSNHLRFGRRRAPGERPTVGLALGSGSIRGTSHIGVLRVLEEENIPIDMIAGTSAGALMGGVYAAGLPLNDCERIISNVKWSRMVSMTLPWKSFVHNAPMASFIESYIGKKRFEDLNIPFAAVASDAITGEAHIMRSGLVSQAICASTAIPAVMRPVQYEGRTLVDGAVVHPVPAALVKSMGADIVIAVNVSAETFTKGAARNFLGSLLNVIDMMSAKIVKEELQLADVVLRPELDFAQFKFKDVPQYVKAGERVTRAAIAEIRSKLV